MTAVLFDMDGVLVDSEDYWVEFEATELFPDAVPDHDVDLNETSGMNFREIYDYLDDEYGTAISREEWIDRFDEMARDVYTEEVSLLSGLPDLLAALDERNVTVAVVSSSPRAWISLVLDRFDLADEFDAVVSADDIDAASKPAPDVYEHAASVVGEPTADCVAVEDSENGIEAADRAGTTVVAYRIDAHGDLEYERADAVVDDPGELRETVFELSTSDGR
ncbi:HAD family hydrolase [Halovivax gelatinilyticus]|uniref:HAD family hydrolase n=1 Tax=Halovivax gelatinilyticus TaxID=2961597 RepID=UPI0020CA5B18|nr:HAD family phosphatase [Halovivax gelatinilyticus]